MKKMYVCEKCGKMSENLCDIQKCEDMHYSVNRVGCWDEELMKALESGTEYKEGQEEPTVIHVLLERSYWDGDVWKQERRCGKYRLISSYEAPMTITNE